MNDSNELHVPTEEEIERKMGPGPEPTDFKPFSQMTEEERAKIKQAVPAPERSVPQAEEEKTQ